MFEEGRVESIGGGEGAGEDCIYNSGNGDERGESGVSGGAVIKGDRGGRHMPVVVMNPNQEFKEKKVN